MYAAPSATDVGVARRRDRFGPRPPAEATARDAATVTDPRRWQPTHVLQMQSKAGNRAVAAAVGPTAQRQPTKGGPPAKDKPKKRRNVVLLGDGWPPALARVLAPNGITLNVLSVDDAATQLRKITDPIGVLYVVAHSTSGGLIKFGDKEGLVAAADVATKLKGVLSPMLAPKSVDFRACNLGKNPGAM